MRKLNHWFREFLNENCQRVETNYSNLVSQNDSISDGINHLPMSKLYRRLICEAMENAENINSYTQSAGHPLLVYGIQYYERMMAGMDDGQSGFADYVRITVGATAAIQMTISYYANMDYIKSTLLVGMSYYLFMKCCQQHELEVKMVCSEGGLIPSVDELCRQIRNNKNSLVVLTQPANPSGEMYSEDELIIIFHECKDNNCVLLLDICQYDDIFIDANKCNINKIIRNSEAESNIVIINSISKTRAIAGARIGYVICQDSLLADYIDYCNEMFYFNHALGYENALIADLFYRALLKMPVDTHKRITRNFRNIILQTAGVPCYQRVFKDILHSKTVMDDALQFKSDLEKNRNTVLFNYKYCLDNLSLENLNVSTLSGGYNFCIKIPKQDNEKDMVLRLANKIGSNMLSQKDFCYPSSNDMNYIWIRISAAMESQRFITYIDKLKEELESWN